MGSIKCIILLYDNLWIIQLTHTSISFFIRKCPVISRLINRYSQLQTYINMVKFLTYMQMLLCSHNLSVLAAGCSINKHGISSHPFPLPIEFWTRYLFSSKMVIDPNKMMKSSASISFVNDLENLCVNKTGFPDVTWAWMKSWWWSALFYHVMTIFKLFR